MSVAEICAKLGWTTADLARRADINQRTAQRAIDGIEPSPRIKRSICSAFSNALKYQIYPDEITWEIQHM